jgi:adenylate cyclase
MTITANSTSVKPSRAPSREVCYTNPLVQWLLGSGWAITDAPELIRRFASQSLAEGIQLRQLMIFVCSAHPQVESVGFTWCRDTGDVEIGSVPQGFARAKAKASPFAARIDDLTAPIRGQPGRAEPGPGHPVLAAPGAKGAAGYLAVPIVFSDGTTSTVAFVHDGPEGFSDCEVEKLDQSAMALGRLLEMHTARRTAQKLLETYLGKRTGGQVLNGRIQRGAGDDIHAVIWFCDLRDSTSIANSLPRHSFLGVLNDFFDCTAGAVLDHGGEVLRFIGDASLAIFPTGEVVFGAEKKCCDTASACRSALAAVKDAQDRMERLNAAREQCGDAPLRFGLALHMGDVTYGNIGVAQRLEFTVIGAAANHAARLQDLCKDLNRSILISAEFRRCFPGQLVSLGHHALRGIGNTEEVFTLPRA